MLESNTVLVSVIMSWVLYHAPGDVVLVILGLLVVGGALPPAHHGQRSVRRLLPGHRRHLADAPLPLLHAVVVVVVRQVAHQKHLAREDGEGPEGQRARRGGARGERTSQQRRGNEHGAQEEEQGRRDGEAGHGS